jgi:hypothetical protein
MKYGLYFNGEISEEAGCTVCANPNKQSLGSFTKKLNIAG